MKLTKINIAAALLSSSMLFTGCEAVKNANNTQKGAVIGTVAGAVLGGVLAKNVGKAKSAEAGVVLGGVVGGVVGGVIGNKMDKQAKEIKEVLPGAEVERVNEGIKVTLPGKMVNFEYDSSNLTALSKANLDKLADVLVKNPDTNINIYGHTDSRGTDTYNQALSERRSKAVFDYLVAKGIAQNRMIPLGMGETQPVASNTTDEGRAQNRRVEFAITANEKMINEAQKQTGDTTTPSGN